MLLGQEIKSESEREDWVGNVIVLRFSIASRVFVTSWQ